MGIPQGERQFGPRDPLESLSLMKEEVSGGNTEFSLGPMLSYPWATQTEAAMHDSLAICRKSHMDVIRETRLQEEHVAGRAPIQEWSEAGLVWVPSASHRWPKEQRTVRSQAD